MRKKFINSENVGAVSKPPLRNFKPQRINKFLIKSLLFAAILVGFISACTTAPETATPTEAIPYTTPDWFKNAVLYEIFVRSYADSDGDGCVGGGTLRHFDKLSVNKLRARSWQSAVGN